MYRAIIALFVVSAGALFASPLFAEPTPVNEYYWVEGQANLPVIDLSSIKKAGSSATWTYAPDCDEQQVDSVDIEKKNTNSSTSNSSSSQASSSSATGQAAAKLFSCSLEGTLLTIKLMPGNTGSGKIKVIAIPTQSGQTATEEFYYTVRVVPEPTSSIQECVNWDCSLYTAFYMGYEGTSVSQVNEKGNVRLQYSGYSLIDPWNLHIYGDLLQTSVQEQSVKETCTGENTSDECDIEATIAANLGIFRPVFGDDSAIRIGPMLDYNLQKLDTTEVFAKSYYGGVRFAYNKIRFFSIGYGKSEGIPGHRVEFNGQLPIYNEKLIAGMVLNVAVDNTAEEQGVSSGDSINIYLMTRVDFTKIFTSFSN